MRAQYDADFFLWTQQQATLLRQGALSQLDVENLAEEIESMGKRDRRSLGSHLSTVLMHLLKWRYQTDHRSNSWRLSIRNGRFQALKQLLDSPSLRPHLPTIVALEYPVARENAADETGLPLTTFPEECPFTVEHILDSGFWPD